MSHEIATALRNALKRLESFEMAQGHLERPGIRFIYAYVIMKDILLAGR